MRVTGADLATSRARLADLLATGRPAPRPVPHPHLWLVPSPAAEEPCFGAPVDDAEPDGTPGGAHSASAHHRLALRARLWAHPDTPCAAPEVAWVLGLRESDVRRRRPPTAARCGRALLAPFAHWRASLEAAGLLPTWKAWPEDLAEVSTTAPTQRRRVAAPRLAPLGGPTGR